MLDTATAQVLRQLKADVDAGTADYYVAMRTVIEHGMLTSSTEVWLDATRRVRGLGDDLVKMADSLRDELDRVRKAVQAGHHVNGLGELQSRGPRFDQLCALREQAVEFQHMAWHMVARDLLGEG